jgi:glycosyltransferase involved in cell wall biosynthesis
MAVNGRRINVLHLSDKLTVGESHLHGVTRLLSWWIPAYDRREFNVMAGSLRRRDRAGEHLEGLGIRMFYLERGKFDPRTLLDVLRLVRREQIDILHLHGYGSTTFGRLCSWLRRVPCIVHEHMYDVKIPFYQKLADRLLAGATSHAIAVSESVKDFMVRYRALPAASVEVLYNGVPLASFAARAAAAPGGPDCAWRVAHAVPPSHAVVAIVGRLHPIKGHADFLRAASQVLREFEAVTFAVVGDGELMQELVRQSEQLGIAERVRFLGHCSDTASILAGVEIKAIASLSEGIPLTLFEAMAAGCAVVSTDVGGMREVLSDGVEGFLVPAQDPQAMAQKLLQLLRDPARRAKMAARARETAARFDLEQNVRRQEDTYRRLARQKRDMP